MSEDEANLKRCCGPSDCGHENDIGPGGPGRYCIGSACMAWRWRVMRPQIGGSYPVGGGQPTIIYGPPETSKTEGYCGLAGEPQ